MQKAQLAPNIVIKWDPVTDAGQVRFDLREFMLDDQGKPTAYANINEVDIHFEEVMNMAVRVADLTGFETDPVTQQTFPSVISGAMIMRCIKQMTNVIIAEKAEEKIRQNLYPHMTNNNNEVTVSFADNQLQEGNSITDFTVDWGDDSAVETVTAPTNLITHTYSGFTKPTQVTYTVTVNTAMLSGIEFTNAALIQPDAIIDPTPAP